MIDVNIFVKKNEIKTHTHTHTHTPASSWYIVSTWQTSHISSKVTVAENRKARSRLYTFIACSLHKRIEAMSVYAKM